MVIPLRACTLSPLSEILSVLDVAVRSELLAACVLVRADRFHCLLKRLNFIRSGKLFNLSSVLSWKPVPIVELQ